MACTMALTVFTGCGNTKEESKNETTQASNRYFLGRFKI